MEFVPPPYRPRNPCSGAEATTEPASESKPYAELPHSEFAAFMLTMSGPSKDPENSAAGSPNGVASVLEAGLFVCGADDMHPYQCYGPGKCIHCDRKTTATHEVKQCALCQDGALDPAPAPLVEGLVADPPFALTATERAVVTDQITGGSVAAPLAPSDNVLAVGPNSSGAEVPYTLMTRPAGEQSASMALAGEPTLHAGPPDDSAGAAARDEAKVPAAPLSSPLSPPAVTASLPVAAGGSSTASRRQYLGSSDLPRLVRAAGAFGNPMDVFLSFSGVQDDTGNELTEIGEEIEPAILSLYARRTGRKTYKPSEPLIHPQAPWAGCRPDGLTVEHPVVNVEAKNVTFWGASKWPSEEEIPESILVQVTWQAGIARACGVAVERTDVARLQGGAKFIIIPIAFDEELFALLFERARTFWFEHIVPGVPPPIDGSDACSRYLRARYPKSSGNLLPATEEHRNLAIRYHAADAALKAAEERKEMIANLLRAAIGEADGIDGVATCRANKSGGVDWKGALEALALQAGLPRVPPEVVAKFTRPGARVLRVAREKGE